MKRYSLVEVDGNEFSVIGYVTSALKETGISELCTQYYNEATSGDYSNLIAVSCEYLDKANEAYKEKYDEVK